jgi:hypothetical protein
MPRPVLKETWVIVVGACVGIATLLFFMGLLLLAIYGRQIPCDSRFLVATVVAFGAALSSAFLGGAAAAHGAIPLPIAKEHPLGFSLSGGIAVLVLLFIISNQVLARDCSDGPTISCPDTYQSMYVSQLRFGFCYPRAGWELDRGPIDVKAADIYLRNSANLDTGVHFHVSLIPGNYAGKYEDYTTQVAKTWRQLDPALRLEKTFLAGREAFLFTLLVKDRRGIARPTEVMHVYLTEEKLLEIITTRFHDTPPEDAMVMGRVRSSVVIQR